MRSSAPQRAACDCPCGRSRNSRTTPQRQERNRPKSTSSYHRLVILADAGKADLAQHSLYWILRGAALLTLHVTPANLSNRLRAENSAERNFLYCFLLSLPSTNATMPSVQAL